jgi:hypothetical protein
MHHSGFIAAYQLSPILNEGVSWLTLRLPRLSQHFGRFRSSMRKGTGDCWVSIRSTPDAIFRVQRHVAIRCRGSDVPTTSAARAFVRMDIPWISWNFEQVGTLRPIAQDFWKHLAQIHVGSPRGQLPLHMTSRPLSELPILMVLDISLKTQQIVRC